VKSNNQNLTQHEWRHFPLGDELRILDIRYDAVFKAVFTRNTEKSRLALSDLISSFIGRIVTVETVIANEPPTDNMKQKHVRFDVACKTGKGEIINVEMSFNPNADERVRIEYYAARLFTVQDIYGKEKTYGTLNETYQITILAKAKFFPDENFIHNFLFYDPDNRISLCGKVRIITVELAKTKPIAEKPVAEMTNAEAWAVFFEYLTDDDKRNKIKEIINCEEGIAMAATTLGSFTQSEIEYFRELSLLKGELDYKSDMWHARESGRNEANLENARKMKTMGFLAEQIQAVTGLSAETVAQL